MLIGFFKDIKILLAEANKIKILEGILLCQPNRSPLYCLHNHLVLEIAYPVLLQHCSKSLFLQHQRLRLQIARQKIAPTLFSTVLMRGKLVQLYFHHKEELNPQQTTQLSLCEIIHLRLIYLYI